MQSDTNDVMLEGFCDVMYVILEKYGIESISTG